jgi:hypothetical protein
VPRWVRWVADAAGALVTVIALVGIWWWFGDPQHLEERMFSLKLLGAFWAVVPPLWFFVDWWLYKGPYHGAEFERFKLSQDRAKDIWLGLGAAIGIFILKGG